MLVISTSVYSKPDNENNLSQTIILSDNIDVEIKIHKAAGNYAILWVAPGYGFRKSQWELANILARKKNIEVWMIDMNEALFLPRGSTAMRKISGKYVAELINILHKKTGKKIILMSSYYGAIPVLRGARQWQLTRPDTPYLLGAILFSPNLYATIPTLGKDPIYLPIAKASNIPIMIFQAETNGIRWQAGSLLKNLYASGSQTYFQIMPGITSIFYRQERPRAVNEYFKTLPDKLIRAIKTLEKTGAPLKALALNKVNDFSHGLDIELKEYKGDTRVSEIILTDINNKKHAYKSLRNKVTLINFWATWCPPCVEEIPSLNRLGKIINHPDFRIISINYAEPLDDIKKFLKDFRVEYPILLDRNGMVAREWKVIVFPSTFVIGKDGQIKYGVNAAIKWDTEDTIGILRKLLN